MQSHGDAAGAVLLAGLEGIGLAADERSFFKKVPCSGITVFKRNIPEPYPELRRTLDELQSMRPAHMPPLMIAIDQEGGRVSRLPAGFVNHGPAMQLASGGCRPEDLTGIQAYAREVGDRLLALGVNVNFAPATDILTEPTNTAIGDRCFGTDPDSVALRAGSYLKGLSLSGVKGCLKHFPGQGDAKADTHLASATIDLSLDQLWNRELVPFRRLIEMAPMVMISHCIYPALSPQPASYAPEVMTGLLRRQLGFGGLIVSDDMNMEAVPQDLKLWADKLIAAMNAGADLLLVCRKIEKCQLAHDALVREAKRSRAFAQRLEDAALRVIGLRNSFAR
jgi:beta-N-acetylhexosaminidase